MHRNCCVCFVTLFQKSGFRLLLCAFPWKRKSVVKLIQKSGFRSLLCGFPCLDINHILGSLPNFIHQNWTCRSSLSFELADLLSLFIHYHSRQEYHMPYHSELFVRFISIIYWKLLKHISLGPCKVIKNIFFISFLNVCNLDPSDPFKAWLRGISS